MWTELVRIRGLAEIEAKEASLALCERYRKVVATEFEIRVHRLRSAGFEHPSVNDPSDLAHEFLFVHVPERQIIQKAKADIGRFRDYLWRCLQHFWTSKLRLIKPTIPVEDVEGILQQPDEPSSSARFDLAVARQLARTVLAELQQRHHDAGTENVFFGLHPLVLLREHGRQVILAKELQTTTSTVSRWLKQLDNDFLRIFRDCVRGIVWNPRDTEEVEEEVKYLLGLWLSWRQGEDAL